MADSALSDNWRASGYVTWHKDTGRCVLWLHRGRRMADGSGTGQNRQTGESH